MEIVSSKLTEKLVTALGTRVLGLLVRHVKENGDSTYRLDDEAISRHMVEVRNWCTRIQFFGLSKAHLTERQSVALQFHQTPRRFRGTTDDRERRSEKELLRDPNHHLVLGDPGSGKTTTLKRLAYHLLTSDTGKSEMEYSFPIVILCRDLTSESLIDHLASSLGIHRRTGKQSAKKPSSNGAEKRAFRDFVVDTLNRLRPLVLIDGLDEASAEIFGSLMAELAALALSLDGAKLVATCRSGLYSKNLDGFDLLEILPLSFRQIEAISRLWLSKPQPFYLAINDLPYTDVLDRPLLLTQLLFLFKHHGYLPRQPASVYRRVVQLLLEDWDAERGVRRKSAYAHFEPDRKIDFLSELSFILTVDIKSKAFTREQFVAAYDRLSQSFALPSKEAETVAAEIESHTGIIVRTGFEAYEFAHLSLQEYLCANYVVRAPFRLAQAYMHSYPAPVAVSIAISSDPAGCLCELLGRGQRVMLFANDWASNTFLNRLILERPCFRSSRDVGVAFIRLLFDENLADEGYWEKAIALPGVRESVTAGFLLFWIAEEDSRGESKFYFQLKSSGQTGGLVEPPPAFWADKELIRKFARETEVQLFIQGPEGETRKFRPGSKAGDIY